MKNLIAPSILSANFAELGKEVHAVIDAGADIIHFDVMDNHYVPNLTIGPMVCKSLIEYGISKPIDVHLMTEPVDDLINNFAKAGASWISFHPEASKHVDRSLSLIKEHNCKAGLALNPATPISCLEHVIEKIDFVLLMTVNPGFGGQKFIKGILQKIKECKELISSTSNEVQIEVDGGIDLKNIKEVSEAGANIFVSGSTIFNSSDYSSTIKEMKSLVS